MPWKVLGRKWHLARKGFPPGKKPAWNLEVLEELLELLGEVASATGGSQPQFLWNNQQVINVMVPQQRQPWATVYTKQLAGVDLVLNGPTGGFDTERIKELAANRAIKSSENELDQVKLRFIAASDLHNGDLPEFLAEHLAAVVGSVERIVAS